MRMTEDEYQTMRLNQKNKGLEAKKSKSDATVADSVKNQI